VTLRRERRRAGWYWYAYRGQGGRVRKAYAGKAEELTADRLRALAATLAGGSARPAPPGCASA
jgi:LuxR family transcriptional regulator, maltose regulon positive regulatory protein